MATCSGEQTTELRDERKDVIEVPAQLYKPVDNPKVLLNLDQDSCHYGFTLQDMVRKLVNFASMCCPWSYPNLADNNISVSWKVSAAVLRTYISFSQSCSSCNSQWRALLAYGTGTKLQLKDCRHSRRSCLIIFYFDPESMDIFWLLLSPDSFGNSSICLPLWGISPWETARCFYITGSVSQPPAAGTAQSIHWIFWALPLKSLGSLRELKQCESIKHWTYYPFVSSSTTLLLASLHGGWWRGM